MKNIGVLLRERENAKIQDVLLLRFRERHFLIIFDLKEFEVCFCILLGVNLSTLSPIVPPIKLLGITSTPINK